MDSLSLWLFPVPYLLRSCWGSPPCVLRVLLFLASVGFVLGFFWFPSFVTRSNLSSFATGSSLRAESPLSAVSYLLSHGFGSCKFVFGVLLLLIGILSFLLLFVVWAPLSFVGSSLGFLYLSSLLVGVSVCAWFVSLIPFCCSLLLGVFPAHPLYGYRFLLFYSLTRFQLCYPFHLICVLSFLFVGGETLVSSLSSSLRSSALLLECLVGRCAWLIHLSPLVRCVHGIVSLARSHIGC